MYRIPRSDICMADAMPFHQHWEARVPVPIKEVGDVGLALHAAFSSIKPGDEVVLCAFDKHDWLHMIELATYRITSTDDNRIKVVQVGEIVAVPKAKKIKALAPGEPLDIKEVNGTFQVRDGKGNVIETFVERKQAEAFARREGERSAKAA